VVHPVHYLVIQQINKQKQNEQQKWKKEKKSLRSIFLKKTKTKRLKSSRTARNATILFHNDLTWKRDKLKVDYRLKYNKKKRKNAYIKKYILYTPKKNQKNRKMLKKLNE